MDAILELTHTRTGRTLLVLVPALLIGAVVLVRAVILAHRDRGKTSRPPDA